MIEMKKIELKSAQDAVISKFGLTSYGENIVMGAFSGVNIIGAGVLSLVGSKVYLADLKLDEENSDITMYLSLARATLFCADLSGIKMIYVKNPDILNVCKLLRFKEENDEFVLSLEGFFTSECE